MKTKLKAPLIAALLLLSLFIVLVILVKTVDIGIVGDSQTKIGLSTINENIFSKHGYLSFWDKITDALGYLSLSIVIFFAVYGVLSLIKIKKFSKLDKDFYALAGAYVIMAIFYVVFEKLVINYRPILIEGEFEASFPSSHTMLALVALGTAIIEVQRKIKNRNVKYTLTIILEILMAVMVIGRLLAGVHWFTDILGAVLLSGFIVFFFLFIVNLFDETFIDNENNQ